MPPEPKIVSVIPAGEGWRAVFATAGEPPVSAKQIVAWAFVSGEDERGELSQRLVPLCVVGPVINSALALPDYIGIAEPGQQLKDFFPAAEAIRRQREAEAARAKTQATETKPEGTGHQR